MFIMPFVVATKKTYKSYRREITGRNMNYICNLHDQSMENKESSSHHAKKKPFNYEVSKIS